jgi:hypothetical protein
MKKIKEKRANKEMKKAHIDEYSATDKKKPFFSSFPTELQYALCLCVRLVIKCTS